MYKLNKWNFFNKTVSKEVGGVRRGEQLTVNSEQEDKQTGVRITGDESGHRRMRRISLICHGHDVQRLQGPI